MSLQPRLKEQKFLSWQNLRLFVLIIAIIGGVVFAIYQIYLFFNRTSIDRYLRGDATWGVAIFGSSGSGKTARAHFISVAAVYPQRSRVGLISFFPQTKLHADEASLGERLTGNGPKSLISDLEKQTGYDIPYYIHVHPEQMSKLVDLAEGLPYFMFSSQREENEILPSGEFLLDGVLTGKLLDLPAFKNEEVAAHRIYRFYSFLLNFWRVREAKWKILREPAVFDLAVSDIETNLRGMELMKIGDHFFGGKEYSILVNEAPIKREKDEYILDAEAFIIFAKSYRKTLESKANLLLASQPKMEIMNGSGIPNLARKMRTRIARKGIRILEFTNADREDYNSSVLLDMSGNTFYLENVANILKPARVYHAVNRAQFTDLILILGRDYKNLKTDPE